MAFRYFQATLTGTSGLLLSNNLCSDPLSEASKLKKHYTNKNKKVDADHWNMRKLDWVSSGYWSNEGTVSIDEPSDSIVIDGTSDLYMPSINFERCLRNGATAFRLGKEVTRALVVNNQATIEYDGPRDAVEMLKDKRFVNTSPVVRKQSTNWVTRVVIPQWSCKFDITVDDDRIPVEALERILKAAGQFEGLGTWRPRFGRFRNELVETDG